MVPLAVRTLLTACLLLGLPALAQTAPRTVAVVSLIGDKVDIVTAQGSTGSHLDRNLRDGLGDAGGAFDHFTLSAAARAIAAVDLGIGTALILVPPSRQHDQPEQLFDGKQVALPGPIIDEIERVKARHVVLITKLRGDMRVPFVQGTTGIGKVRGLGFYIDGHTRVRLENGGEIAVGFLAPFAYFQLTLVEVASGMVVRERPVTQVQTVPVAGRLGVVSAWDVLTAAQKVGALQRLIRRGLDENLPALLQGL